MPMYAHAKEINSISNDSRKPHVENIDQFFIQRYMGIIEGWKTYG